jgi:hypothetical protein
MYSRMAGIEKLQEIEEYQGTSNNGSGEFVEG